MEYGGLAAFTKNGETLAKLTPASLVQRRTCAGMALTWLLHWGGPLGIRLMGAMSWAV
jgi:hypothetical protein